MKKFVLIFCLVLNFNVKAWENCGDAEGLASNCEWEVSIDGVLTIRPQNIDVPAIIPDYERQGVSAEDERRYLTTAPWYNQREQITSIKVEDGIEYIGNHAFMELRWATSASMADSVVELGEDTFTLATRLSDIRLSNNLKSLGGWNFQQTYALTNITFPESLEEIGSEIFYSQSSIQSVALPDGINFEKINDDMLGLSNVSTIYCSKNQEKSCVDLVTKMKQTANTPTNLSYGLYERYGNGYLSDGKFYTNLGDIGTTNNIKKRIYTIDEANAVAGEKNRVSIKYR
ncbi:MAG: leucine-rich repeat domain-containing protein [Alphaproteobacteria bacterium]|nr:leucine-rich repeat domain-containing protein [Alphaproteobacteria bacterium]